MDPSRSGLPSLLMDTINELNDVQDKKSKKHHNQFQLDSAAESGFMALASKINDLKSLPLHLQATVSQINEKHEEKDSKKKKRKTNHDNYDRKSLTSHQIMLQLQQQRQQLMTTGLSSSSSVPHNSLCHHQQQSLQAAAEPIHNSNASLSSVQQCDPIGNFLEQIRQQKATLLEEDVEEQEERKVKFDMANNTLHEDQSSLKGIEELKSEPSSHGIKSSINTDYDTDDNDDDASLEELLDYYLDHHDHQQQQPTKSHVSESSSVGCEEKSNNISCDDKNPKRKYGQWMDALRRATHDADKSAAEIKSHQTEFQLSKKRHG